MKFVNRLVIVAIAVFLVACTKEDAPKQYDYSKKILGEWQQVTTFNLVDPEAEPLPAYDWFDVEDGFTLKLFEDGNFIYTKYGNCTTGTYFFNQDLAKIKFSFDCEIDFYGEKATELTESFAKDKDRPDQLFLMHANGPEACVEECNSILKRIDQAD